MKKTKYLTETEEKIMREQIIKNSALIDRFVYKIDLLMNREGHKKDSEVVLRLRKKLMILMEENDTFRKVYWRHVKSADAIEADVGFEAVRYLILKIKTKNQTPLSPTNCNYTIGTATL